MLHIGIDFGTTNSVVATSDRTGCQVVHHRLASSPGHEVIEPVFPSLVAHNGSTLVYGLDAEAESRRGSTQVLHSIKRVLSGYHEGQLVTIGDSSFDLREVLTGLLSALRASVLETFELEDGALREGADELSIVATVPANANGAQRWITRRAMIDAGWSHHLRLIDEPTAAALEYVGRAVRRRRGQPPEPMSVLVYDMGGGTFDASLVRLEGDRVEVLSNGGEWRLGGDDFDAELAELVAETIGLDLSSLPPHQQRNLLAECRRAKESLSSYPRSPRSILVSLGDLGIEGSTGSDAKIDVSAYSERLLPYLTRSLEVVNEVLDGTSSPPDRVYLVGGSTLLPLISETLSERFHNVVRGSRPFESVAIGAAMSQEMVTERLTHRLARHFGVLRVGGRDQTYEYVDVLFPRGTKLPLPGETTVVRRGPYRPFFDVGVLQYLECATVTDAGKPGRNRRDWQVIRFPYERGAMGGRTIEGTTAQRREGLDTLIIEEYVLDSDGIISVRISRGPDGYSERHEVCG